MSDYGVRTGLDITIPVKKKTYYLLKTSLLFNLQQNLPGNEIVSILCKKQRQRHIKTKRQDI